jgi:hypothetical protein
MSDVRSAETVDLPLRAEVIDSAIVIRVGAGTVAWAGGHHPEFWDGEAATADGPYVKVTDPLAFTREVALALEDEREDGSSILSDALDAAVLKAIGDGCEGVDHD